MSDRRKRRGSPDLTSPTRQRRQRRRSDAGGQRGTILTALTAVLVATCAVAAGVAIAYSPEVREPAYEPKRVRWEDHETDLEQRKCFRRYYRMEKEAFHKLAELLRPLLEVNAYYASMRTVSGAISVEVRLAVALRILAGASYLDAAMMFGLALPTAYTILWQVIDSINKTPAVGAFYFPEDYAGCLGHAERFKRKSTDGVFEWVVAAVDGLFIKTEAPTARDTANVTAYYSGSKCGYGINVQAMCTADYRFCSMSAIAPGSTNDWMAWLRSSLSKAVSRLPLGFHIIGDAAYPVGEKLLTPYPGKNLPPGEDSFNFHLSQLRVKIEQSFGILVSTWGILWRPLRVQYAGRGDLITALFHLHNFLQDEKVTPVHMSEEDATSGAGRPTLSTTTRTLPEDWQTTEPAPSRSGETPTRAAIRTALEVKKQWRPEYNIRANS